MVETVAISGDIFRTESVVLKDKPIEQGPFAHCDDDKEVVITDEGKILSDAKTRWLADSLLDFFGFGDGPAARF